MQDTCILHQKTVSSDAYITDKIQFQGGGQYSFSLQKYNKLANFGKEQCQADFSKASTTPASDSTSILKRRHLN